MDPVAESEIDQTRLRRFLGYRLTRTEILVHKLFLQRCEALSLKPGEYSILVMVDANPGIYLRQLGEALDISPSNLVPVLDRLVQRDLMQRRADTRDRRLQQLHLTATGQAVLSQAEQKVEELECNFDQILSPAERVHLISALDKLSDFMAKELAAQLPQRREETTMPPTIKTKARA